MQSFLHLALKAGKLYVGCNNGSLHIYSLNLDDEPATGGPGFQAEMHSV